MATFKAKSLTPELTDKQVKDGCFSSSLLSFERAIRETIELNREKGTPIGYRITEQGIIILWK